MGLTDRCLNTHDSLLLMGLHSCSTTLSSTGPQSNHTRRGRLDAQNNVLLGTLLSSIAAHEPPPVIETIIPDGSSSRIIWPTKPSLGVRIEHNMRVVLSVNQYIPAQHRVTDGFSCSVYIFLLCRCVVLWGNFGFV